MTDIIDLSYKQMAFDCQKLANSIKKDFPSINRLVAITRGGLFPTLVLSHLLSIKNINCIGLESYEKGVNASSSKVVVCSDNKVIADSKTLFVDDLFDSGNTIKFVKNLYPNSKTATLYLKDKQNQNNLEFLDFYGINVPDKWLKFEYEVD